MSAHTPGPWLVDVLRERQFVRHVIRSADNTEIAKLVSPPDDAVAEHNARLIAAAPDMLHALTIVEKAWAHMLAHRHGGTPAEQREPVLNCIRAAIAKATGEQS